jgi:hypothetical protein
VAQAELERAAGVLTPESQLIVNASVSAQEVKP